MKNKILVIDDEQDICLLLERFLTRKGFECTATSDEKEGFNLIKANGYDLVITDLKLPTISGIELLQKIKILSPQTKVIIITGYSDIKTAVEAMRHGASDYVSKPLYPDELLSTIKEALKEEINPNAVAVNVTKLKETKEGITHYIVGSDPSSKKLFDNINLVAPTDMSVLIYGETGTGKEFVAKEIHARSDRKHKTFVAVDCGALPKDIASSEFFGHEKGAFTGAIQDKEGLFKVADGGTLFLDEIANLSYEIQVQLLRVLQERKFKKVGGNKEYSTDIRVLAATHENLLHAVKEGTFREDLYYRLNEFELHASALKNRPKDIEMFANHFLAIANNNLGKSVKTIDHKVLEIFQSYNWPGNLREMKNVIKRATLITTTDSLTENCLPEEIIFHQIDRQDKTVKSTDLKSASVHAEREAILKVLTETGNNKTKAAEILNIDRKTLYNKLKNLR